MFSLALVLSFCLLGSLDAAFNRYASVFVEDYCTPSKAPYNLGTNSSSSIELHSGKTNALVLLNKCSIIFQHLTNAGYLLSLYSVDVSKSQSAATKANMTVRNSKGVIGVYPFSENRTFTFKTPKTFTSDQDMTIFFNSSGVRVKFNMTITRFSTSCSKKNNGTFDCNSRSCIWSGFKCDGHINCEDGKDEAKGKGGGCNGAGKISGVGVTTILAAAILYISSKSH